jgi:hypothetical protein
MFPPMLKGVDRLLHAAMCETLGFKGSFRPVHLAEQFYQQQKPERYVSMEGVGCRVGLVATAHMA